MNLFIHQNTPITAEQIAQALRQVGVAAGDTVFVHSSLMHFGSLAPNPKKELLQAILALLQDAVGAQGTLIMPTFTYSFTKNEPYDVLKSKSTVGSLSEFFRKQPEVTRNEQPLFSVAAWGKNQDEIHKIGSNTFDESSIFGVLRRLNAKVLMFGAEFYDHCTFFHHIEYMAGVPYRYLKTFEGEVITQHGTSYHTATQYNVRHLNQNVVTDGKRLKAHLQSLGLLEEVMVGNGSLELVRCQPFFEQGLKMIASDPHFMVRYQ